MATLGSEILDLSTGYAFAEAAYFSEQPPAADWNSFQASWQTLAPDVYNPSQRLTRFRRYSGFVLDCASGAVRPLPRSAFRQSATVNPISGGVDRWFEPLTAVAVANPWLPYIIRQDFRTFDTLVDRRSASGHWHIQVHQIRVHVLGGLDAVPVPEGLHRDGHEFLAIHLVSRSGVVGGESIVCDALGTELARRSLVHPLDSLFINDRDILHDVSVLSSAGGASAGLRDVLIVDFDHADDSVVRRVSWEAANETPAAAV